MVDAWLVILCIIVPCVLTFVNMLFMAYFMSSNKNEREHTTFPRVVVLLGMLVAECTVLLLPLDVGNRSGVVGCGVWNDNCGGLDMIVVWELVYCLVAAMVVVVVPFAVFWYEAASESNKKERLWWTATKYVIVLLVVVGGLLVVGYIFLRKTYIPVDTIAVSVSTVAFQPLSSGITLGSACGSTTDDGCKITSSVLKYDVTFVIYMAALLSFLGWFLFAIYTSIGLVAVPLDFINGFIHRRKMLSNKEVASYKLRLKERSEMLMQAAAKLKEEWDDKLSTRMGRFSRLKASRQHNVAVNKLRLHVEALEDDYEKMALSDPKQFNNKTNVFINHVWPFLSLLFGILSIIISALWIAQIVLYMLIKPAPTQLLNDYLTWFDTWFPLFGTLTVAIFSLYLLFAAIKGINKFGTRFALITVYPMKPHNTLVNSFLFNVALALLCAMPVTQFTTEAFASYARLTDADVIFGSQVRNLEFFRYFFQNNVFLYGMLVISFLSLAYFICSPAAESVRAKEQMLKMKKELEREKAMELRRMRK